MSTTDNNMKFNQSFSLISSIAFKISSFLHKAYHGLVVSSVPIHAFVQFNTNSL
jgi:hypothetical protein